MHLKIDQLNYRILPGTGCTFCKRINLLHSC